MKNLALMLCLSACGGPPKANPCTTPGATYFVHAVEANNGTCGVIPDQIVNVSSDGTVAAAAGVACDAEEHSGCTTKKTNCKTTSNGVSCSSTSSIEFAKDGSQGSGLLSMNCSSGATSCISTYQVVYLRQ